ncbi:unnamed protein product, partial [Prorocentrum cordatum]
QIKTAEGEAYARTRKTRDPPSSFVLRGGAHTVCQTAMDSEGAELEPLVDGRAAAPSTDADRTFPVKNFEAGGFFEAARRLLGDGKTADRAERKDGGQEARLRQALDGGAAIPVSGAGAWIPSANVDGHGERFKAWRDACAEVPRKRRADRERVREGLPTALTLFKNSCRQR